MRYEESAGTNTLKYEKNELARREKMERENCTTLERLPVCPAHGKTMVLRPAQTKEQDFCGTWYDCPQCANSVLIPSKELLRFLVEMDG